MKNRVIYAVIALFLAFSLTGCVEGPQLSEEQEDLVAEYAGGVLLRYSHKYDLRLVENDVDEDGVEDGGFVTPAAATAEEGGEVPEEMSSETPVPEATVAPESSDSPDSSTAPDATQAPEASESPEAAETETPEATEEPKLTLDELYDIDGLSFSYKSSKFTRRYPEDSDDIVISPDYGQILYVVSFNIKNTTSKAIRVNLTERAFHYELDIGGDTVLPTISLLPNGGLNYLMTRIGAGKTEEAVLIFNVDRSRRNSKGNTLTITEGDKSVTIDL